MKKLLILSCALAFCLALAACHTTDSADSSVSSGSPSSAIANESTAHQTDPESSLEEGADISGYCRHLRPNRKWDDSPCQARQIPCRLLNRKAKRSLSLRLPLRPSRKTNLPNRLRNPGRCMPGPRTPERSPIRCWNTSTASAHHLQSNAGSYELC